MRGVIIDEIDTPGAKLVERLLTGAYDSAERVHFFRARTCDGGAHVVRDGGLERHKKFFGTGAQGDGTDRRAAWQATVVRTSHEVSDQRIPDRDSGTFTTARDGRMD